MTYLFYDIETTGLHKSFDQILQFAAIRTDEDLKTLEKVEYRLRLNPDVIPAPEAVLVHQIPVEQMLKGDNEYDAIQHIHALMNTPDTVSLGYNTLNFDDEFLRFAFYKNLLDPYSHQYANGCARMDIYPMTVMYYLFKPDVIQWPENEGRVSMRLENINALNKFAKGAAHDAMVDVEATVELAKRLKQASAMWAYLAGFFDKKEDVARQAKLPDQCLLMNTDFGTRHNYLCPVLRLGQHQIYKNQTLWLRLDDEALSTTDGDSIGETTWVVRKKQGELGFLLPPEERFNAKVTDKRWAIVEKNRQWLDANPQLLEAIKEYYQKYTYPDVPNVDIDSALYTRGFMNAAEKQWCVSFHKNDLNEKIIQVEKANHPELKEQAMRILGRSFYDELPLNLQQKFDQYVLHALNDGLIDYRNEINRKPLDALGSIDKLLSNEKISPQDKQILTQLREHIEKSF